MAFSALKRLGEARLQLNQAVPHLNQLLKRGEPLLGLLRRPRALRLLALLSTGGLKRAPKAYGDP